MGFVAPELLRNRRGMWRSGIIDLRVVFILKYVVLGLSLLAACAGPTKLSAKTAKRRHAHTVRAKAGLDAPNLLPRPILGA